MASVRTVFLDRDGVINRMRPNYVKSWGEFVFLPGAKQAIWMLGRAGIRTVIVTNQRAVALGRLSLASLAEIHENMLEELHDAGASVDAIYYCPHDVGQCMCRKPQIGMFLQAYWDMPAIDFAYSAIVGDSLTDMEAGWRLGARTFLVADRTSQVQIFKEAASKGVVINGVASSLFDVAVQYLLPSWHNADSSSDELLPHFYGWRPGAHRPCFRGLPRASTLVDATYSDHSSCIVGGNQIILSSSPGDGRAQCEQPQSVQDGEDSP